MNQRGIVSTLVLYGIIAAVVLGIVGTAVYKANHWCNAQCEDLMHEVEKLDFDIKVLQKEKADAQERATALALMWSAKVDEAARLALKLKEMHDAAYKELRIRAANVNRAGGVRFRADLAGVFRDSASAANEGAAPAAGDQTPPPAVPDATGYEAYDERELARFFVDASAAYRDAVNLWRACVQAYDGVALEQLH